MFVIRSILCAIQSSCVKSQSSAKVFSGTLLSTNYRGILQQSTSKYPGSRKSSLKMSTPSADPKENTILSDNDQKNTVYTADTDRCIVSSPAEPHLSKLTQEQTLESAKEEHVESGNSQQNHTASEDLSTVSRDDAIKTQKIPSSRQNPRKRKMSLHATFKRPRLTSDEELSQTTHYFENGLRKVVPYDFKYNTFAKGRWVGKTLGQIYTTEFRLYPIAFYERAIREKRLLVNLKPAKSLDRIIKDNDLITSLSHRHECPISADPITVVADNDEFFVINKPCCVPLHPAGRFRHNSLLSILARDFGKTEIFSIHRLDRMTSGLTVFAKSKERAGKCHVQIRERTVEKEYVCRVSGDFTKFSLPEDHDHRVEIEDDVVIVSEAMKVYDMKIGTSIVSRDEEAKECTTTFQCLSTDGVTSVVRCKPKTGRTHQIRVHLQYLGFPIANDMMYNTPAWGEDRFRLGPISKPMKEVMAELASMKKWTSVLESFDNSAEQEKVAAEVPGSGDEVKSPDLSPAMLEAASKIEGLVPYRADCEECKNPLPDPRPEELVMYLHALKYRGPDWEFETPMPEWAADGWVEGNK